MIEPARESYFRTSRRRVLGGAAAGMLLGATGCKLAPASTRFDAQRVLTVRQGDLELYGVRFASKSPRLTYLSKDEQGMIWASSDEHVLNRYDPSAAQLETIPHPFDAALSQCIYAGGKVYMLGKTYPWLMIYDRSTGRFSEKKYPVKDPDVWYGAEEFDGPIDGRHLYLFDRGPGGVIKWDSATDTGRVIRYPYDTPRPYIGRYVPSDRALWCNVWDFAGVQYAPVGLARLDLATDQFDGWFPFPKDDAGLATCSDPDHTLFIQQSFDGKLTPFDFRRRRFCRFVGVPKFGESFGWIGMSATYRGRWYFTLATLTRSGLGIDGKPTHFLNAVLQFDPRTGRFSFPTVESNDAYYQVSYLLGAGGELYATCNNILRPDGRLDVANRGELAFLQSVKPTKTNAAFA